MRLSPKFDNLHPGPSGDLGGRPHLALLPHLGDRCLRRRQGLAQRDLLPGRCLEMCQLTSCYLNISAHTILLAELNLLIYWIIFSNF